MHWQKEWRELGSENLEGCVEMRRGLDPLMAAWIRSLPQALAFACQPSLTYNGQETHFDCMDHLIKVKLVIKREAHQKSRLELQAGKVHNFPF